MTDFKYPDGYTPMTDEKIAEICNEHEPFVNVEHCRAIEKAVLASLKPDAEREALVARISYRTENWVGALESETQRLLRDIRAHLTGGVA